MATDKTVNELIINKLTQAQFDAIPEAERSDTELYFITDADTGGGKGAQVEEMPEATETNAGQIVQYVGETIPDTEAIAIITQTVGDSLTDLQVDIKKFEKASGLINTGSLEFIAEEQQGEVATVVFTAGEDAPGSYIEATTEDFIKLLSQIYGVDINSYPSGYFQLWNPEGSAETVWSLYDISGNMLGEVGQYNTIEPAGLNIQMYCTAVSVPCVYYSYTTALGDITAWNIDAKSVNISDYGITYSGTPSSGDTLKVDYTPFISGYEKGYFYINQARLSKPMITVEQTVGNSLSNLSVDVDKFIEAEQPTGNVAFDFTVNIVEDYIATEQIGDWGIVITNPKAIFESLRSYEYYAPVLDNWTGAWINYVSDDNSYILGVRAESIDRNAQITLDNSWFMIINVGSGETVANITEMTEGSIIWHNNNTPENLNNYGISYNGTPSNGDTITVNYVASTVVGHSWNQINVQPASKGNGGIEWVTKLDLPAEYPEQYRWSCHPIWTIPGGVPDGTYEFYTQSICGTEWEPERAGVQNYTVKVLVKFYTKNNMQYHFGSVSYVVDGTWTGDANFRPEELLIHSAFKKDSNNLYFWYDGYPFHSALPGYVGSVAIPGIFKMSAWKNIDSGETYIPLGTIYEGNHPHYDTHSEGQLNLQPLCTPVRYPHFYTRYVATIDENRQYALVSPNYIFNVENHYYTPTAQSATFNMKSTSGGTFYATTINKNGSCVVQDLESSGDLKNVQLGIGDDGYSYIYFNNNDLSQVEVLMSATGMSHTDFDISISCESWTTPSSFTPLTIEKVGAPITAENLDKVLQYTQESTDEYAQGHFYKAVGDITTIPENITLIKTFESDFEISLVDGKDIISTLSLFTGWSIEYIKENLPHSQFLYSYGAGNPYIWWNYWGDIYDQEFLSCFNVIPELEIPEGYPLSVDFTLQYNPASQKVENGRWEQVNVQPASEVGGDYLPLTGGTMSGDIAFGTDAAIGANYLDGLLIKRYLVGRWTDLYGMNSSTITPMTDATKDLGWSNERWRRLYATKLNNGADLTIPTESGTLARIEDIPEGTQLETLPTASADNLNKIYQYVGETTSDYINGRFYKCVEASVVNLTMLNSFMNGASATLVDQEKFLSQNPIFADSSISNTPFPAWRADYQGDGTWNVWTQTPNLTIDPAELTDVWGITVSGELQEYDMIAVMKQEEMGYAWKEVVLGNSTTNIPAHPTTPGAYTLMCYVDENGSASYAWENVA